MRAPRAPRERPGRRMSAGIEAQEEMVQAFESQVMQQTYLMHQEFEGTLVNKQMEVNNHQVEQINFQFSNKKNHQYSNSI